MRREIRSFLQAYMLGSTVNVHLCLTRSVFGRHSHAPEDDKQLFMTQYYYHRKETHLKITQSDFTTHMIKVIALHQRD